jgi:Secretion system C-terminal sorting domain
MKTNALLLFLLIEVSCLFGQDWQLIYRDGGKANDFLKILQVDSNLFACSGKFSKDSIQGLTIFKMDTTGHIIDSIEIFKDSFILTTYAYLLGATHYKGQVYLYGSVLASNEPPYTYLIVTDTSLQNYTIHYFREPTFNGFNATNILATENGLYLLGRVTENDALLTTQACIICTDFEGNVKWNKKYGVTGIEDFAISITQLNEDTLIVAGGRYSPYNSGLPFTQRWWHDWIMGIDSSGKVLWNWESSVGINRGGISDLHIKDRKLFYASSAMTVSGTYSFTTVPDINCRSLGNQFIWQSKPVILQSANAEIHRLTYVGDSSQILGVGELSNHGPYLHFIVNTDDGSMIYQREDPVCVPDMGPHVNVPGLGLIPPVNDAALYDVIALPSGSTISCGKVRAQLNDGKTVWSGVILKTNAWGEDLLDDCSTVSSNEPQYTLNELFIYPNPASDHVTLQAPEQAGTYRVRMYASTGTLVREQVYAQGDVPEMQVRDLSTGLYFVQILREKGQLLGVGKVVLRE